MKRGLQDGAGDAMRMARCGGQINMKVRPLTPLFDSVSYI